MEKKETFTVLIGPPLTRQQFFRAISAASLVKTDVVVLKERKTLWEFERIFFT